MKGKKILNIIVDVALFAIVFSITDYLMISVIKSESFWLELVIYVVLYGIVFGLKSALVNFYKRRRK